MFSLRFIESESETDAHTHRGSGDAVATPPPTCERIPGGDRPRLHLRCLLAGWVSRGGVEMRMVGKKGKGWKRGIVQLWQREVGDLTPRTFEHRLGASEDLIWRLGIYKKLDKHRGCVNTVSFNADGDILISGSDDRMIMLWDWERGVVKLSFHSGHHNNVFQARMMPYTDDKSIITCAADGEVRHARILEGGRVESKMLARHEGRAHKMAVEPGSPYVFYSCGEDGLVQRLDLRTQSATQLFICKSLHDRSAYMPIVQLNAIAIDPWNPNLFAIAGGDEYARLYDIRKCRWDGLNSEQSPIDYFCPPHLIGDDQVGITGLAFSEQSELLASYNDELIYLFSKDQGLGPNPAHTSGDIGHACGSQCASSLDMDTDDMPQPQAYSGHQNFDTVKGVNFFGPNCEYVVSGSDCGRLFIWRKKDGELLRAMEGDKHVVNCIEPHPHATMIASSGIENDIKLWIPNAMERVPPINIHEVLTHDRIACFALDDYDYDYIDDDDDDDDNDIDVDDDDGSVDTDPDFDGYFDSCDDDNDHDNVGGGGGGGGNDNDVTICDTAEV